MKTILINGRFLTQRLTGVQRYAHESLLALDSLLGAGAGTDLRFELVAPKGAEPPPLRNVRFREVGPWSGNLWEQVTLARVARGMPLLSFGPTGPLLKRNQIVTVHDAAVYAVPAAYGRSFRTWYKLLLPLLARRIPRVLTVSEFSKGEVVRHLRAAPGAVAVCGGGWQHVLQTASDPGLLAKHALRAGRYVLAVSSLSPHKNFAVLTQALAYLRDVDVVVAGAVDAAVFGKIDRGALGALKLVGYVSDAQLRALYEHAGAFVFPSLYEGFGLPPLEAMALGCPVIAASAAAIPEVCGAAALYFDPHDPAQLAAQIAQVLSSPEERARRIAQGHLQVARHSWNACARRQLEVVTSAFAQGRGARAAARERNEVRGAP